jgi:hypothetical protein
MQPADSDDVGRAFRLMSATHSNRSRPAVPIDVGRGGGAPAAGFGLCMFISCGQRGAVSSILPPTVAVGGAVTTGALLFIVLATLGFLVSQ